MKFAIALYVILLAVPSWAGTYRDDFEDGEVGAWQKWEWLGQNTGSIQERNGVFVITDAGAQFDTVAEFDNRKSVTDFTLSFSTMMAKANEGANSYIHIILRAVEENGDWWFIWNRYDANGEAFLSLFTIIGNNGQEIEKVNLPFVLEVGEWYRIRYDVDGRRIKLWIDGDLLQEVDWSKHSAVFPESGFIQIGGGGGEFHFDNFVITGDEISDFAIDPVGKLATSWAKIRSK
jgi:hypothetical protein